MFTRDQQGQYLVPSHPTRTLARDGQIPASAPMLLLPSMITKLAHVSILVPDLDEALDWYTNVLGLEKREDNSSVVAGFRWLTVAPKGQDRPRNRPLPPRPLPGRGGPQDTPEPRRAGHHVDVPHRRLRQGIRETIGAGRQIPPDPRDGALGSPGRLRRPIRQPVRDPGARQPLVAIPSHSRATY